MNNAQILEKLKKVNPSYLVCGSSFDDNYTSKMKDISDLNGVIHVCNQNYWEEDLSINPERTLSVGQIMDILKTKNPKEVPQLDIEDGLVFRDLTTLTIRDDLKVVIVNT